MHAQYFPNIFGGFFSMLHFCGFSLHGISITYIADLSVNPVTGVLDKPYSEKPAQRSSHTSPPGYMV